MIKTIGFSLLFLFCSIKTFCAADCAVDDALSFSSLQLDVLVKEVIRRNPNLDATRLRIQAAHEAVHRIQVLEDPQVTITSDQNKFHKTSDFTPMMSYEVSQEIPFPGKLRLKGEIAKQVMLQKQSIEITTYRELIRQTKLLYYQLYTNTISLRINEENTVLIKALIEDSLALYRSGKAGYADAIKMQLELQMLEDQKLMLIAEGDMFKSMLNALLNRSPTEPLGEPIADFTPPFELSFYTAEAIALSSRSELQGMEAMIMEQEKMAQLARRNYYPDFMVGLAYEQMNNNFDGHIDNAWMLKVGFNIPIWILEKQAREVREARSNAFANQRELEGMQAMISGKLKELLAKLKSTDNKISLYKNGILPKVKEALFALLASYRSGETDFLLLLDTWRQAFNAELDYENYLSERERIIAELERAMGVNLEEVLCDYRL
jgi:outer membrane protein TolC